MRAAAKILRARASEPLFTFCEQTEQRQILGALENFKISFDKFNLYKWNGNFFSNPLEPPKVVCLLQKISV